MRITNKGVGSVSPSDAEGKFLELLPGSNEVDPARWDLVKDSPLVKALLDQGRLEVELDQAPDDAPAAPEAASETPLAPPTRPNRSRKKQDA